MILKARPRVIFLDFDGVIIQSNEIKDRAFEEIFNLFLSSESTSALSQAREFHYSHNALTRRQKFEHIVKRILDRDDTQMVEAMVARFGEITRGELLTCPYVEGAMEFLTYWHERAPLYLVSATPKEDLDKTVGGRGIGKFFKKVFGAGQPKSSVILSVAKELGIDVSAAVFFGDSPEDLRSSKEARVPFIGIHGRTQFEDDNNILSFPHLRAADEYLRSVTAEGT